jgi:ABC-type glycerol-3-phosphate transport system substrate-binding protein
MKRSLLVCLTAMVLLTACGGAGTDQQDTIPERDEVVTIYKSPT